MVTAEECGPNGGSKGGLFDGIGQRKCVPELGQKVDSHNNSKDDDADADLDLKSSDPRMKTLPYLVSIVSSRSTHGPHGQFTLDISPKTCIRGTATIASKSRQRR